MEKIQTILESLDLNAQEPHGAASYGSILRRRGRPTALNGARRGLCDLLGALPA